MKYVEGESLKRTLDARGGAQVSGANRERARRGALTAGCCTAILKPAHIPITLKGASLLDFGRAKFTVESDGDAPETMEGMFAGTAACVSPEQTKGGQADQRSGVFSFGASALPRAFGQKGTWREFNGGDVELRVAR